MLVARTVVPPYWTDAQQELLRCNLQVGEITLSGRLYPQCNSALPRLQLQIADDKAGLLRSVHVKPRFVTFHFDLVLGPDTGL